MKRADRLRGITSLVLVGAVGTAMGLASASEPETGVSTEGVGESALPEGLPGVLGVDEDGRETLTIDLDSVRALMGGGSPRARSGGGSSWSSVSRGFTKVASAPGEGSFYGLWLNPKTNQMLAELPRGYEGQKHFFAMTVAGGETFAGLQAGDMYVQWQKINDRLALVMPQLDVRSTGDQESRDSVDMIFTDRVLLSVPIVTTGPSGQPVIDLDALLVGNASRFFGGSAAGLQSGLTKVSSAKAFPKNIEVEFEGPARGGTMKKFHYSISLIRGTPGFKPRAADARVGYFTTSYEDFGKFDWNEVDVRYINRWHLEKADRSLKLSPPKEPIVYYVEHTVPIRYRRWVKAGIDYWNDAYRAIGIDGAIEVRFQDKRTGAHMDKDPEDVRYNFIRWLSNDVATAIGPSRVNPETGEILDADIVLTDGWVRVFRYRWAELMPEVAMEGMGPQTLAWLDKHPNWDPRVRFASVDERDGILRERAMESFRDHHGHAAANVDTAMLGDDEFDGLAGRTSQLNGMCRAAHGKAMALSMARMYLEAIDVIAAAQAAEAAAASDTGEPEGEPEIDPEMLEMIKKQLEANPALLDMIPPEYRAMIEKMLAEENAPKEEDKGEEGDADEGDDSDEAKKAAEKKDEQLIDGLPEWFVGPMLAELVAHEAGHTLGLRHNFKASAYYTYDEINSPEMKGSQPWAMSVMDYNGVNIRMPGYGDEQGDYSVIDIGPYDHWAIEYGYGFGDPSKVAEKAADPKLQYGTDEDTWGPDPLARRYDMAKDPHTFAKNQMALVTELRKHLLEHFVDDGDSWARARRGYRITLSQQMSAVSMMANWIGSAYVYRDRKGDPDGRAPIDVVPADQQRDALTFVVENTFRDEAYGLTPELLRHMTVDKWWDAGGLSSIYEDATYPLHEQILGMQASALTMVLNPTTLSRVYDLEAYVPADQDALTLDEVLATVTDEVWSELDGDTGGDYSSRKPMISSLRRNLQREHLDRLIDLSMMQGGGYAAASPIKTLAVLHLRDLHGKIGSRLDNAGGMDAYTRAHLTEAHTRIEKALDAGYIYNQIDVSSIMPFMYLFGQQAQDAESGAE